MLPLELKTSFKKIFSVDLRSLALFRVSISLTIIADLINRGRDLRAHYTDFGVLPRAALIEKFANTWHLSIHHLNGTVEVQFVLFLIAGLFALSLLFGYKTRLCTVISWFLLISLHSRNPVVLQGGDIIFRLLLFWGMLLPLGARYSVDSALDPSEEKQPDETTSVACVAILLQIGMIYWFSAALKTDHIWREDGTAIYYALNIDQFATSAGLFLLQFPLLLKISTFVTFYLEAFGPCLAFVPFYTGPLRTATAFFFISLHLAFAICLELGLFSFIGATGWLIFLPGWFWDKVARRHRLAKRNKIKIYYDGECGFCKKGVFILQTFFLLPRSNILPAQEDKKIYQEMQKFNSWVVFNRQGRPFYKFSALLLIFESFPLTWPLAKILSLKPFASVGDKIYESSASRRPFFSQLTSFLTWRPVKIRPSLPTETMAAVCLFFALFWNLRTVNKGLFQIDPKINWVGPLIRLDQKWNMFAPHPLKNDGWYVIPGKLKDGTEVDVFKGLAPVRWEKPRLVSKTYKNQRWRKYMMNLWKKEYKDHRFYYSQYLCRDWNSRHAGKKKLESLEIYFMKETTKPNYQPPEIEKVKLETHDCFKKPTQE